MTNLIKFQNNELEVININGTPYLRGRQIGDTLQLAKGYRAVQKIFQRRKPGKQKKQLSLPFGG